VGESRSERRVSASKARGQERRAAKLSNVG
jgi:hypothetical protein